MKNDNIALEKFEEASKKYICECLKNEIVPDLILESFKKLIDKEIKGILRNAKNEN